MIEHYVVLLRCNNDALIAKNCKDLDKFIAYAKRNPSSDITALGGLVDDPVVWKEKTKGAQVARELNKDLNAWSQQQRKRLVEVQYRYLLQ